MSAASAPVHGRAGVADTITGVRNTLLIRKLGSAGRNFLADDAMSLAAAVAFYTALSFAPLVLLLTAVGGVLGDQTRVN